MARLIDAKELAVQRGLHAERWRELARQHLVPHVRVGRSVLFDPERVDEWIAQGGQSLAGGWRHAAD